ncbi:MAG: hypothetical protein AAFX86_13285 [Pseudomonadota bacterium]
MDERTQSALALGWRLVAGVLANLHALPGLASGWLDGPVWARAFAELRLAEAAARRLIIALADPFITPLPNPPAPIDIKFCPRSRPAALCPGGAPGLSPAGTAGRSLGACRPDGPPARSHRTRQRGQFPDAAPGRWPARPG